VFHHQLFNTYKSPLKYHPSKSKKGAEAPLCSN